MAIDQNEITRIRQKAAATIHLIDDGHEFFRRQPNGSQDNYTFELKGDLMRIIELTTQISATPDAPDA